MTCCAASGCAGLEQVGQREGRAQVGRVALVQAAVALGALVAALLEHLVLEPRSSSRARRGRSRRRRARSRRSRRRCRSPSAARSRPAAPGGPGAPARWTSEMTSLWVSTARPITATISPMPSTLRGLAIEKASARSARSATPVAHRVQPAQHGQRRPRGRHPLAEPAQRAPQPGQHRRDVGPLVGLVARHQRGEAGGDRAAPAPATMPSTSSAPKPRTIGTGESSSTRKPAAGGQPGGDDGRPAGRRGALGRRLAARRVFATAPRRSGPGTGWRSPPPGRSAPAARRSRPW